MRVFHAGAIGSVVSKAIKKVILLAEFFRSYYISFHLDIGSVVSKLIRKLFYWLNYYDDIISRNRVLNIFRGP